MRTTLIAVYSIVLGLAVLGLWALILSGGALPEGRTELAFHLTSELLMALAAIASGVLLLRRARVAPSASAAAHAMVVYSTLNAAGYYAERGEFAVTAAMTVLALLSATIAILQIRHS